MSTGLSNSNKNKKVNQKEVDEILSNPLKLSRWLSLLNGIKLADDYKRKYNLPETEIDSAGLLNYINETAPLVEAAMYAEQK